MYNSPATPGATGRNQWSSTYSRVPGVGPPIVTGPSEIRAYEASTVHSVGP